MIRLIIPVLVGLSMLQIGAGQGYSEQFSREAGPSINLRKCTAPGQCRTEQKQLTIDANWRWVHVQGDYKNCYDGNEWIKEYCPGDDGAACAGRCVLEGVDEQQYKGTYGVEKVNNGEGVSMKFVNKHKYGTSVGSRLYMYENDKYEMFKVVNREFAFDADMSQLECGMNGAVYFVEMEENGGKGKGKNQAGAKFGTGYCDAQCPHDIKFIDGEANIKGWRPNPKDKSGNMGTGHYGACCNEMDIWEANARSNAYTPHPCRKDNKTVPGVFRCEGIDCGDNDKGERYKGICDKDGCDFASWRHGDTKFYGKGDEFKVNTNKKFTQVTQFITNDGTDDGDLVEIRRFWVQDGKVVAQSFAKHLEKTGEFKCKGYGNSITDQFCVSMNQRFGDYDHFTHHGGLKEMGESLKRGHVLAISLWDDVDVAMMWLDSWFPRNQSRRNDPGIERGPCPGGKESEPMTVRQKYPDAKVTYTNFAVGALGSTTPGVEKGPPAKKDDSGSEFVDTCPFGGKTGLEPATRRRTTGTPATRRRSTRRRSSRRRSSRRRRRRASTRRRTKSRRRSSSSRRRRRRASSA